MKNKTDAIIRLVLLTLAIINQTLVMIGKSPLPIADELLVQLLSAAFTIWAALVAYWKNNSWTPQAIQADKVLKILKEYEGEEVLVEVRGIAKEGGYEDLPITK